MEKGHNIDAPALMRRKRKVARQQREKTPEPSIKILNPPNTNRKISDEESSSTTTADQGGVQTIKMQIRPPGTISTHKSKILNRRNKTISGAAIRSASAPRECIPQPGTKVEINNNSDSAEITHLLRYARRSLSSPRNKEESSGSARSSPPLSPQPTQIQTHRPVGLQSSDDERLSRLERNLQRFEQERRKFEIERLLFEREKRELHRMRYRQFEREDRRRLLESHRKFITPSDLDDKLGSNENLKEHRFASPKRKTKVPPKSADYESSTASSIEESSEEKLYVNEVSPVPPERRRRSLSRHSSSNSPVRQIVQKSKEPVQENVRERKKSASVEKMLKQSPSKESSQELIVTLEKEDKIEQQQQSLLSKFFSIFNRKKKTSKITTSNMDIITEKDKPVAKLFSIAFMRLALKEFRVEWKNITADYPQEVLKMQMLWRKCITHTILLALLCGFGGLIFRFIEGSWENSYKCVIRNVKRDFIDQLWLTSHNLREDDWKSEARNKLRQFEEGLQTAFEAGVTSYSEIKAWSFINSVMFCLTVVTTIGYGHIAPKTTLGRAITIVYAIIGIPIFLILLADFGKLFTRMIKFVWAYVRRLYYTGTCRKVRKQQQVQDVMRGMYTVYDYAIRRPSTYIIRDLESDGEQRQQQQLREPETPHIQTNTDTPTTPYPETIEVDDEFNLPITVATGILLTYIFAGATVYVMWEDWSYFESFYFVFVSMSTIGFGDFVPKHPIFMMCSIIYLIFGLALTSMFINVVQIKLSDSFKHASAKIGATIGLVAEPEDGENQQKLSEDQTNSPGSRLDDIQENDGENAIQGNHKSFSHLNEQNNNKNESMTDDVAPPPLPRKPINNNPSTQTEEKRKRRFF